MKRDTRLFSDDFKLEMSGEELEYDTSHIYTGQIYGQRSHETNPFIQQGRVKLIQSDSTDNSNVTTDSISSKCWTF